MTTATPFSVTWDYRCPFARNAHEHIIAGLEAGAPWDVTFVPFSLAQVHVSADEPDVWDEPSKDSGLLALQVGVVVRDRMPDRFLAAHRALFAARHDHGRLIDDREVLREALGEAGVDADEVFAAIDEGWPLATVRKEHEDAVANNSVWGVPTFISGDRAVFVRLMDRPQGDGEHARRSIDRVLDLLTTWPELNEYKYTSISR